MLLNTNFIFGFDYLIPPFFQTRRFSHGNVGNKPELSRPFAELMASSGPVVWRERRFHSEKLPDFSTLKNRDVPKMCPVAQCDKSLLMIDDAIEI